VAVEHVGLSALQTLGNVGVLVPAWQMGLLVALLGILMLTGRNHLGLLVTYLFVLYWGYISYWPQFVAAARGDALALCVYLLCGLAVAFMAIYALFCTSDGVS
jgi:hypothetical protein